MKMILINDKKMLVKNVDNKGFLEYFRKGEEKII